MNKWFSKVLELWETIVFIIHALIAQQALFFHIEIISLFYLFKVTLYISDFKA